MSALAIDVPRTLGTAAIGAAAFWVLNENTLAAGDFTVLAKCAAGLAASSAASQVVSDMVLPEEDTLGGAMMKNSMEATGTGAFYVGASSLLKDNRVADFIFGQSRMVSEFALGFGADLTSATFVAPLWADLDGMMVTPGGKTVPGAIANPNAPKKGPSPFSPPGMAPGTRHMVGRKNK